jgi:hypothetical protein
MKNILIAILPLLGYIDKNTVLCIDMFDTLAHGNENTANAIVCILKNNSTVIDSLACDSLWVGKDPLVDDDIDVFLHSH